jgi:hypothetical protein
LSRHSRHGELEKLKGTGLTDPGGRSDDPHAAIKVTIKVWAKEIMEGGYAGEIISHPP